MGMHNTSVVYNSMNGRILSMYAPTSDCNKEEIDMFYDNLDMAKVQYKSQEIIIVMGDLNGKAVREAVTGLANMV